MKKTTLMLLCCICVYAAGFAQQPSIGSKTTGMEKHQGFFSYYWDENEGKIWLEISRFETEFLLVNGLSAGLGSNDVGLDRGRSGGAKIVKFHRVGPKVLLVQPNYGFRATTDNIHEQQAVNESFAQSIIWGFTVAAEENGTVLVDATPFLVRDGINVIGTLKRTNQGTYRFDESRSALFLPRTKNFPQNTEFEVILTFTGDSPGNFVRSVTPDPSAISVRQHYSFVQLPDDEYEPRPYDPRSGVNSLRYMDYSTPISEPIVKRFTRRHRLKKKNPGAAISDAVEPIIYYLDRGAPEPIRSALLEGARWWNEAFEAAGYRNALRVELLPEDADPMDVRYNVINWVHRSTRGWSSGGGVTDPRTGEIIKGKVTLGSQRVRQDFLIAEGLLAPYEDGNTVPPEMERMALARLQQLSAHEVGHTLGFAHNYFSSVNDRGSVLDYPHPLVTFRNDGSLDLSDAYDTGIGEWDKISVAWAYQDFPPGTDEQKALNKILTDAMKRGLVFLTDQDARSPGTAHPFAHLWDNGTNAVDELNRIMQIRRRALDRFSAKNIREGAPMATLEEVLVPTYLFHRYQIEAASKVLGGAHYFYALRGDGQKTIEIVPPEEQRRALNALLETVKPEHLTLDERILNLIPPRPPGYGQTPELFQGHTSGPFDPLAAAETAANLTISMILNEERAARLIEYNARDNDYPGLTEIIDKLIDATWKSSPAEGLQRETQYVVDNLVLYGLMNLSANSGTSTQVRAIATLKIDALMEWIEQQLDIAPDDNQRAHFSFALSEIEKFQKEPDKFIYTKPVVAPAGAPIGMLDYSFCEYSTAQK